MAKMKVKTRPAPKRRITYSKMETDGLRHIGLGSGPSSSRGLEKGKKTKHKLKSGKRKKK